MQKSLNKKYAHTNAHALTYSDASDVQLVESVKDVSVGARVCSLFNEYPGQNFFDKVTEHFAEENL